MKNLITLLFLTCSSFIYAQFPHNGYAPDVIQKKGQGNGNNWLEFTPGTKQNVINNYIEYEPVYQGHYAPVKISVYDTSAVIDDVYQIAFSGVQSTDNWKMYRVGTTDTVYSANTISSGFDQFIPQWGLVVTVSQFSYQQTGSAPFVDTLGKDLIYSSTNSDWLGHVVDNDTIIELNWQGSGSDTTSYLGEDTFNHYENFGGWNPYRLSRVTNDFYPYSFPIADSYAITRGMASPTDFSSVDIYFTSDTSLWTRCPVIETGINPSLTLNNIDQQKIKTQPSLNKQGLPDNTGTGMSWFPGYALDLETGERLNMAFGENSIFPNENGADMWFNPTENLADSSGNYVCGGYHFVYIFVNQDEEIPGAGRMPRYDGGIYIESMLNSGSASNLIKVWRACNWVGFPILNPGHSILESDALVKLRVGKVYTNHTPNVATPNSWEAPLYQINISQSLVLSTSDLSAATNNFSVYPNPASSKFLVIGDRVQSQIQNFTLFDLSGRVVMNFPKQTGNSILIERDNMPAGIYIYQIEDQNHQVFTGKIVFE